MDWEKWGRGKSLRLELSQLATQGRKISESQEIAPLVKNLGSGAEKGTFPVIRGRKNRPGETPGRFSKIMEIGS